MRSIYLLVIATICFLPSAHASDWSWHYNRLNQSQIPPDGSHDFVRVLFVKDGWGRGFLYSVELAQTTVYGSGPGPVEAETVMSLRASRPDGHELVDGKANRFSTLHYSATATLADWQIIAEKAAALDIPPGEQTGFCRDCFRMRIDFTVDGVYQARHYRLRSEDLEEARALALSLLEISSQHIADVQPWRENVEASLLPAETE